jgi:hypothetical protein
MRNTLFTLLLLAVGVQVFGQGDMLPDNINSCRADSVLISVNPIYDSYLWNTGDTTSSIWAFNEGKYWLDTDIGDTLFYSDTTRLTIVDVSIVQSDTTINCGDTILISIDDSYFDCLWIPGDILTDSLHVFPRDNTTYYVNVTDPNSTDNFCTDSIEVEVTPIIVLDTLIQNTMGCPGENKASLELQVSGGFAPPYTYEYSEGIPDYDDPNMVIKVKDGEFHYVVTDTLGCTLKGDYNVKAYGIPEVELNTDPADTIYRQRPYIEFTYENTTYDSLGTDTFFINTFSWDFGDGGTSFVSPVKHTYSDEGNYSVVFSFDTYYGCKAADSITIVVKPVKFKIPSAFTPNGDGINEKFIITYDTGSDSDGGNDPAYKFGENDDPININDFYNSNTLIIFNRWGQKVYEMDNYTNDWDGDRLSDGTYFYILVCEGEHGKDVFKGSVQIVTGGR